MKPKILSIIAFIMLSISLNAEKITLSFYGSGAAIDVESVEIKNLSTGDITTITGNVVALEYEAMGIQEKSSQKISVYPCPFINETYIKFVTTEDGNVDVGIYNNLGETVAIIEQFVNAGMNCFKFSAGKAGIYYARINSASYSSVMKIFCMQTNNTGNALSYVNLMPEKPIMSVNARIKGNMSFTPGDYVKFTCRSGVFTTILVDAPIADKSYNVEFDGCSDADGNNYAIVKIGNQTWMAENLRTTKYNDSAAIPNVTDQVSWAYLSTPAFCWYNNNPDACKNTYGALYKWYAVKTGNLAPAGWHIPTYDEWMTLLNYLGMQNEAGGKMKETGTGYWISPNSGATNHSGFSALPGGSRKVIGVFDELCYKGYWWSVTDYSATFAWRCYLSNNSAAFGLGTYDKNSGYSIRCIKN